jgi:hypothetical protein
MRLAARLAGNRDLNGAEKFPAPGTIEPTRHYL